MFGTLVRKPLLYATFDKFSTGRRIPYVIRRRGAAANVSSRRARRRSDEYTTLRQAVLAHDGEARSSRLAFEGLSEYERDAVIEFLKTLQVLPPGTKQKTCRLMSPPSSCRWGIGAPLRLWESLEGIQERIGAGKWTVDAKNVNRCGGLNRRPGASVASRA